MLKFIIEVAFSVWLTSSLFMLYFWANAFIVTLIKDGKIFWMPLGSFLYVTFCPIIHTRKCFDIMRRYQTLKAKQREM